jgi:hypothetical protein
VVAVRADRLGPKAALFDQVPEEARDHIDERDVVMRTPRALEPGKDELEHLLERAADVLGERASRRADEASVAGLANPLVHEGVDVARKLCQ